MSIVAEVTHGFVIFGRHARRFFRLCGMKVMGHFPPRRGHNAGRRLSRTRRFPRGSYEQRSRDLLPSYTGRARAPFKFRQFIETRNTIRANRIQESRVCGLLVDSHRLGDTRRLDDYLSTGNKWRAETNGFLVHGRWLNDRDRVYPDPKRLASPTFYRGRCRELFQRWSQRLVLFGAQREKVLLRGLDLH